MSSYKRCGHRVVVAFTRNNPHAARPCVLKSGHDGPHRTAKGETSGVFSNRNVCGIKLRTFAEDSMGMCERCASE